MMNQEEHTVNKQIKFRSMLWSSDYSDAYILFKENISVNNTAAAGAGANNTNKKIIFKNCAPFTDCIRKINNTQADNAEDIDIVMAIYNLIEYSDNYWKTSGNLWQYYKNIPALNNNGDIVGFNGANATDSFNFKAKITDQTDDDGEINNVEIMVPLKYLSNFWGTLEIPLTETKLYIPVVTLSTQDNAKLLPQLKSGFKRTISWNKYLAKPELLAQNANLNHLIEPSFQGVNRLFVLAFENDTQRTSNKRYYIPSVEINDYNVMIDGKKFFDQPINNMIKTYENIRQITIGQGDDYTTGCLLDYTYFKKYYTMISVDLSKQ